MFWWNNGENLLNNNNKTQTKMKQKKKSNPSSNFPGNESKHPPISPLYTHTTPASYLAALSKNEENQNPIIEGICSNVKHYILQNNNMAKIACYDKEKILQRLGHLILADQWT